MNSYLILKVSGKNIPKFILRCKNNNINILKLEQISYKEALIKINFKVMLFLFMPGNNYQYLWLLK